jgi:RNA polymerase sigma factor (sigma-70 family)
MARQATTATAEWSEERLHQELLLQTQEAVEELVARFGSKTYRLALRITGKPEDAQEVTQDVLWRVVRKIDTFKGESALGSWIYRITANAAYQKLRGRRDRYEASWEEMLPAFDGDGHFLEPVRD